jgi:hypothetical protein
LAVVALLVKKKVTTPVVVLAQLMQALKVAVLSAPVAV